MSAYNSLDYRRFDHLGSDPDEEEPMDEHMQQEMMKFMQNRQAGPTPSVPSSASQRTEHTAGPIKIHPQDTSVQRWVYSDPETWEAPVCEYSGKKHSWGVCQANEGEGIAMQGYMRMMTVQTMYGFG